MKGLTLVALLSLVLAIGFALPFTEDGTEAYEAELKQIGNNIARSYPELDDGNENFDEDEIDDDDHEEDENDDDEDNDDGDGDVEDQEKGMRSLSNPLEKSSDPILPFLVFRGARRLFRRRRSRRRRVGRWFRRRRRGRG